ncbi:MAG: methyltransferase domain-containing protein, partial [Akkermansiaceae bacterium]|nr:methyltransferase domain-containing protein [Akkermansiaceae bacterium]
GHTVADIGCGYGAAARWVASSFGARVTAFTLSAAQAAQAERAPAPDRGAVRYLVADWLANELPDASLEAAMAIESLAHMADKPGFFRQLERTLKPGGRAALACWLVADDPSWFERRILEKICEEGRLPGMGTIADYTTLATAAGLRVVGHRDLTLEVERTWWIIARRLLAGLLTRRRYISFLLNRAFRERVFLFTLPRLMLAYRTGAMRYGLLWLQKPE